MSVRPLPIIVALGTTQTVGWASSFYLPAILADPIARDLGVSSNWIFAAFSGSLVISAVLGPRVGRQIDLFGGRPVLTTSNLTIAAGLALLGITTSIPVLVAAWLLLGIGMGCGLYDAAFGALGRIYGDAARRSITGITLIAGFASTVGWPLTALGLESVGWRNTCFAWAFAHILIGLPINFFMLPAVKGAKGRSGPHPAACPDRPDHDPPGVHFCGRLDRHRRDGGAHAPDTRGRRSDHRAGGGGRRTVRPGASGCPRHRGEFSQPLSSAAVDPAGLPDAPDRRRHPRGRGWRGIKRILDLFRLRQRHSDDCARHPAAGDLRSEELWLSPRPCRRSGADGAGDGAAGVWSADRRDGKPHPDRLLRAQSFRAAGAIPSAAGPAGNMIRVLARGVTKPPQAYAAYFVALILVAGLSFYIGTLRPKTPLG